LDEQLDVAVLLLTWQDHIRTAAALQSLCPQPVNVQAVVVDNGSDVPTAAELRLLCNAYGAQYVRSEVNVGYAAGMNIGLACVRAPVTILANNDLIFGTESVGRLVGALSDPWIGIASPTVFSPSGVRHEEWGRFLTPARALGRLFFLDFLFPALKLESRWSGDWLQGPCLALRSVDLRRIGGVPERAFMYSEDMRLCHAIRRLGMRASIIPSAQVVHADEAAASRRWDSAAILRRKTAAYLLASQDFAGRLRWIVTLSFRARTVVRYICSPTPKNAAILRGAFARYADD
jgi:N-acetylglucosaminyl-diphospho-decaprenol L-rhamnosyltransferase